VPFGPTEKQSLKMLKSLPQPPRRNAPWTPFQRRTWLATQRRRARTKFEGASLSLLTDLAAYWKLDEAAGEVRADSHIYGVDLSEWSYFGDEATVDQTDGVLGSAALFSDYNNWGLMAPGLAVWNIGADFTIGGWLVFTADMYGCQSVLNLGNNLSLAIIAFQDAVQLRIATGNVSGGSWIQSDDGSVPESGWTHFAAVRCGSTLTLYLNGAKSTSGVITGSVTTEFLPDLHLGCSPAGYPMNGTLDEFGLWQRALSADEVSQLYNHGSGLAYEMF
jgi:hypothetical protein